MRFYITIFAHIFAVQAYASIAENCADTSPGSTPAPFINYASEAQRRGNPETFVQTLDAVIAQSPFNHLLECRDRLRADPGFSYGLHFLGEDEGTMMSVSRRREFQGLSARVSVTLNFNLKASPQKVLFVYLHELTHVCQDHRWAELHRQYDLLQSLPPAFMGGMGVNPYVPRCLDEEQVSRPMPEVRADYERHRKLGEVEGFFTMVQAYTHFTSVDPAYCHEGTGDHPGMMNGYMEMENKINQGFFAQDIIVRYHGDNDSQEVASALFDLHAPRRLYPDGVIRPTFHPLMRQLVLDGDMPFSEPVCTDNFPSPCFLLPTSEPSN